MTIFFMLLVFVVGGLFPLQSAVNFQLRQETNSPFLSGAISNLIGALLMLGLAFLLSRQFQLALPKTTSHNWWMWLGGVLSALIVTTSIVMPAKLGYAAYIAIFLAGQLIMALLIDNFGLFGASMIPIQPRHIFGIALMISGILMIKR
ncbi:DMT family transporter [Enterococcus hirae]|nr:DMT family transporter [Enterococcus hirae]